MTRCKKILLAAAIISIACNWSLPAHAGKDSAVAGYVIDSACLFVKNLKKPVSTDCASRCAAAGSPLVILSDDGEVYWPIDDKVPARGQNYKLTKAAGKHVKVTGQIYEHGSSKAIVIETVEESGK